MEVVADDVADSAVEPLASLVLDFDCDAGQRLVLAAAEPSFGIGPSSAAAFVAR